MSSKQITSIPFHDFGGKGPTIHFAHANGYPPGGYQQFLKPFTKQHQVIASTFRPLWGGRHPSEVKNWKTYADDLIQFLDQQQLKNIIGMGHSMGGTITAIAALKRPDLFAHLVLLDPVIFSKKQSLFTKFLPSSLLKRIIPIAKLSAKRRDNWSSKKEVYDSWRQKKVFKRFSDSVLQDFIHHAIVSDGKGSFTLAFSKEWETQVYVTAPYIFSDLLKMKMPMTVIKAEKQSVMTPEIWQKWKMTQPHTHFIKFRDAGHLVPMEYPVELSDMLRRALNSNV